MARRSSLISLLLLAACAAPSTSNDPSPSGTPLPERTTPPAETPAAPANDLTIVGATQDDVAIVKRGPKLLAVDLATKVETLLAEASTAAVADDVVAFVANGKLATYSKQRGIRITSIDALPGEGDCALDVATAKGRIFVSSCATKGAAPALRTIDTANKVVTLREDVKRPWAIDNDGARAFVIAKDGQAAVHTVPANTITPIDRDVTWGRFGQMGNDVLYRTTASDLRRAQLTSPVRPVTLIETGVAAVDALSPDVQWMLASASPASENKNGRHDIRLTPVPPGMPFIPTPTVPVDLVRTPTGLGLGFTGDSEYAAYLEDSTLHLRTASDRDARDTVIAKDVVSGHVVDGTTSVVFATKASNGAVDISVVDATSGKTVKLAAGASSAYATTAGKLVFTKPGAAVIETIETMR